MIITVLITHFACTSAAYFVYWFFRFKNNTLNSHFIGGNDRLSKKVSYVVLFFFGGTCMSNAPMCY